MDVGLLDDGGQLAHLSSEIPYPFELKADPVDPPWKEWRLAPGLNVEQIARRAHDLAGASFLTACSVFMAEAYWHPLQPR